MVDTLLALRPGAAKLQVPERMGVGSGDYAVATFHRAGNVDDAATLAALLAGMSHVAGTMPVLFLVHPRTRQRIKDFGLERHATGVRLLDPVGYLETIGLVERAALVLTDSGGLQVETTILGVPCLTARPNTEWTETVESGTNRLVAPALEAIKSAFADVRRQDRAVAAPPRPAALGRPRGASGSSPFSRRPSRTTCSPFPVPATFAPDPARRLAPPGSLRPHRTRVTA